MNKQELIGKYKYLNHNFFRRVDTSEVLRDLKQLDESQKVKVPQYIADKIEYCKELDDYNLFRAIDYCCRFKKCNSWLMFKGNIETFALAWIFGYEVEKEKRYRVKIKGEIEENCLVYGLGIKRYFFTRVYDSSKRNEHTRKQLEEAGFGEVFNSTLFEVEEVE